MTDAEEPVGERWIAVEGYEGLYEVSDLGRIRSVARLISYKGTDLTALRRGTLMRGAPDRKGYEHLVLCKKGKQRTVFRSRIVAKAFVPNPQGFKDVHHKDFDKTNNAANNLEWVTHRMNIDASLKAGNYAKKLTSKLVSEIRTRAANGESQASIARSLGVRYGTVHLVVNRRAWSHV